MEPEKKTVIIISISFSFSLLLSRNICMKTQVSIVKSRGKKEEWEVY